MVSEQATPGWHAHPVSFRDNFPTSRPLGDKVSLGKLPGSHPLRQPSPLVPKPHHVGARLQKTRIVPNDVRGTLQVIVHTNEDHGPLPCPAAQLHQRRHLTDAGRTTRRPKAHQIGQRRTSPKGHPPGRDQPLAIPFQSGQISVRHGQPNGLRAQATAGILRGACQAAMEGHHDQPQKECCHGQPDSDWKQPS